MRIRIIGIVCFAFVLAFLADSALAQQSIGRVHRFSGELQIQHEGHILIPAKAGPIFRNANLYPGDTVRTGRGAAELLFDDGTSIKMDENTIVQVDEVRLSAGGRKERNFKIVVGRILSKIQPKHAVRTFFEVPDGVAAIRGTVVEIWVDPGGNWQIQVHEGVAELTYYRMAAMFSVRRDCGFRMRHISADEVEFECMGLGNIEILFRPSPYQRRNGATVVVPTIIRSFQAGDVIRVRRNPDGSYDIKEIKGKVTVAHMLPEEGTLFLPWWLEDPVIPRQTIGSPAGGQGSGLPGDGTNPPATVIKPTG